MMCSLCVFYVAPGLIHSFGTNLARKLPFGLHSQLPFHKKLESGEAMTIDMVTADAVINSHELGQVCMFV